METYWTPPMLAKCLGFLPKTKKNAFQIIKSKCSLNTRPWKKSSDPICPIRPTKTQQLHHGKQELDLRRLRPPQWNIHIHPSFVLAASHNQHLPFVTFLGVLSDLFRGQVTSIWWSQGHLEEAGSQNLHLFDPYLGLLSVWNLSLIRKRILSTFQTRKTDCRRDFQFRRELEFCSHWGSFCPALFWKFLGLFWQVPTPLALQLTNVKKFNCQTLRLHCDYIPQAHLGSIFPKLTTSHSVE